VAHQLPTIGAERALLALQKIEPKQQDLAQYLLDAGVLKQLNGDLAGSNADLQTAKGIMASLQAASVSENLGALTVNETFRSYAGSPSERVLVHYLLALNYLQLGDLDGARVEMLQADVTMKAVADTDSLRGQLASVNFLSGVVYELNDEFDNAMISYRRALGIMDARQQPIPVALQDSLLQISQRQGMLDEYQQYTKRFSRQARLLQPGDRELLVFYADGNVTSKQQHTIPIFSPQHRAYISLALPYYPANNYRPRPLILSLAGQSYYTEVIENIEQLARKDLADQLPVITATTLARAAIKYQAVRAAQNDNNGLNAMLLNIGMLISEQADLRSWNILPSSLQVARIPIAADVDLSQVAWPAGRSVVSLADFVFNRGRNKALVLVSSNLEREVSQSK